MKNPLSGAFLLNAQLSNSVIPSSPASSAEVRDVPRNLCHAASAFGVETRLAETRAATFLDCARLEGDLALCTALATDSVMHLTVLRTLVLALSAAVLAPLRCGELLARVEFLFTFGERKGLSAIAAL